MLCLRFHMIENIKEVSKQKSRTLDEFTLGFIYAALWSSTDQKGRPIDDHYNISDFSKNAIDIIIDDCSKFQTQYADLLNKFYTSARTDGFNKFTAEHAGHDYWMSRNGHTPLFWNKSSKTISEELNKASLAQGNAELFVDSSELLNIKTSPNKKLKNLLK